MFNNLLNVRILQFKVYPDCSLTIFSHHSALFLVEAEECLYLWQGWFPVETSDNDGDTDHGDIVTTGSGQVRWQAERRAAMSWRTPLRSEAVGLGPPREKAATSRRNRRPLT